MTRDYDVGYGRPPKRTRFKPGQSGNPSGRPKKKRTPAEAEAKLLLEDKFMMRVNGKARRLTAYDAILRVLIRQGMDGNMRAIAYILKRAEVLMANAAANEKDRHVEGAEILIQAIRETFLPSDRDESEPQPIGTSPFGAGC